MGIRADWIAVDWGTSHLRVWAMSESGSVMDEASSSDGMGALDRLGFEPALLKLIGPWLGTEPISVMACGMVGARQGWAEAPYAPVPCTPLALVPVPVAAIDPRLRVHLIPGLRQDEPPDVMRGEETQIAGVLATKPGFDGVLCLPGTHTKWAEVGAAEVLSFRTFMTGELFAILSRQSILRHSVGEGWDDDAFAQALSDTLTRPETLAARLFSIRAEALSGKADLARATSRLSGFLVGAELAATRSHWLGRVVAVVGADAPCRAYALALRLQGVPPTVLGGAEMTRQGLAAMRAQLRRRQA